MRSAVFILATCVLKAGHVDVSGEIVLILKFIFVVFTVMDVIEFLRKVK